MNQINKKQVNKEKKDDLNNLKKFNQIEYIVKGFANKRRIEILFLLKENSELSVSEISEIIKLNYKNTSAHLLKMMATGLVMKRNLNNEVRHALTTKGKNIVKFLKGI